MLDDLAGDSVYARQQQAVLAYESGQDARAEALLQGMLRLAPNDPETWLRLGNLYGRSARPDLAADAYQRGLALAPRDARLWHNLGVVRRHQALAALIQAHDLLPADDARASELAQQIERLQAAALTPLAASTP